MRPRPSTDPLSGLAVLVPQTSFLGDVVLTTPLLEAVRERLRPRRLAVMVRPEAVALVDGHPAVDTVMVDDKYGADRGPGGIWRVARRVRAERFDLAVVPHRSLRTALMLSLARVPRRVGFDSSRGWWLLHDRVHRDTREHDVIRNLTLLEPLGGLVDAPPPLYVPVGAAARTRAATLLARLSGPVVGIAPGSVWPTKRWTDEGFAAVTRALAADGCSIVLLGAPGDEALVAGIARRARVDALDLAGRTDLATFVAVVDRLDVLVSNDSAPMHVATARGTPVVAVFCATTPALGYGPYSSMARVIEADLACRPCGRHGGRRCPRGTDDCRHLVEPERVTDAVRWLLRGDGGGSAVAPS